jgi:hypothetical protein
MVMKNQTNLLRPVKKISNLIKPGEDTHIWNFSRVGGVNRVNLFSGKDITSLKYLDQKLWTALSCPAHGLEIDPKTIELIDTDHDDRIRVAEVLEAVEWVTSVIKDPDELMRNFTNLPLSSINNKTEEGKELLASARQILVNLGKANQKEIGVEETSDTVSIFADTKFNGDGIITEDSADSEEIKKLIADIILCMGSVADRGGKPGITAEHINDFYQNCEDYSAWHKVAEDNATEIMPFGPETPEAQNAFFAVKSKIDDYFLRCRLAEYDENSTDVLNLLTTQYEAISTKDLSTCLDEIALFPIAITDSEKSLPLTKAINPSWEKAVEKFRQLVVIPLLPDKTHLSLAKWESLPEKFEAYNQWMSEKTGSAVEILGLTAVHELLEKNQKDELLLLIEQDLALEKEANNILKVDKLVRYFLNLFTLLENFVNFSEFYSHDSKAIFQAGSLYIDQRCCDLCIKVNDMPKHNSMAGHSGICLLYCECYSKVKDEKMTIVAALSDGNMDNITIGRNAVFYDRSGLDWDATIVKIIENPISIRQAFWSPYRRMSKFISTQIEKVASSKDKEVDKVTTGHVEKAATHADKHITETIGSKPTPVAPPPAPAAAAATPPAQPFDIGKFVGIFAAISLALGAIGSVLISVLAGFFKLLWWQMPLAIIGIMLCISLPSMILAWLKLRKRNLAPVLDANGWAINARITINILFGRTLTHLAALPENSKLNVLDPFTKKKKPVIPIIIIILIVLAVAAYLLMHFGYLAKWGITNFRF